MEQYWLPWRNEHKQRQGVQRVYGELFTIYKRQQQLGEQYEVVLGLGLLTLRTSGGLEIRRHLLTAQPSLTFDASRGVITIGPSGEGAKVTLEQDMLEVGERPPVAELTEIEGLVSAIGDNVWSDQTSDVLRSWAHAASPRGRYDVTHEPQREYTADPVVRLAPAIILRKRQERSLLRVLKEIAGQLREGGSVPVGVKRLVTVMDDEAPGGAATDGAGAADGPVPEDTYFPLPSNDEQQQILAQLATRHGLLVQGPPGTGKSHTIANLISHLLATGQRVLVTSHTARALKSLRDKIPPDIAPLCVLLLGEDINARQALDDSVRGITDEHNRWDADRNARQIQDAERRLDAARKAEARALGELRDIREAETRGHHLLFGGYAGTAQSIAMRLRGEEPKYSWLGSLVADDTEAPLSDEDAGDLLGLLRAIAGDQERELKKHVVTPGDVLDPDLFDRLLELGERTRSAYEGTSDERSHLAYAAALRISSQQRHAMIAGISRLLEASRRLAHSGKAWVPGAINQVLSGQRQVWGELSAITSRELDSIKDAVREVSTWNVSGLGDRDLSIVRAQATALLEHLEAGRKLGFGPFRPKVAREGWYLVRQARVNGRPANAPDALRALLEWIRVGQSMDVLAQRWKVYGESPTGPLDLRAAGYRELCDLTVACAQLGTQVDDLKHLFADAGGLPEPKWQDREALERLSEVLAAADVEDEWREVQAQISALDVTLTAASRRDDCHPVIQELAVAVAAREGAQYRHAHAMLERLLAAREDLRRRDALLDRLKATAPSLATTLLSSHVDPVWDVRLSEFVDAWNWVRADRWLSRLSDPHAAVRATEYAWRSRRTVLACVGELAAAKAWRHCLSRLTEEERQHLKAWQNAMRLYGKGQGKYAATHLRNAREHMEHCRSAIPAWIMPIYKVAETVRPGRDVFDVVIVDEASQSGPEALFLAYLAKKMIVVGDEQQISPEAIGIRFEDVSQLRRQYIPDLPLNDTIGVDTSFFSQAEIRYPGRIRLREHFRCMPEIIQFSNNLCYSAQPLIPLRQYGTDRLEPVVIAQYIPNGYLKGVSPRLVNLVEAEAIAEKIAELCKHSQYEGKTMGVISLLGEDQARLIERLLIEKIGAEEIEKRRLVCGDAYAFQGDERHVMFLSMVSAVSDDHRIGVLAKEQDKRRFNVAASRAQDQMWLFHSVTLSDLSPACLRRRLLEYCLNPRVEASTVRGLNLTELRQLACGPDRHRIPIPEPFGSWFEVDVFLNISERGYRVLPQFQFGGRRIDLAIEGLRGRLAVECDGDEWHGAEQYEQDMARQRDLERCGWIFWRVRGSTYYRDPQGALAELWQALDRFGIYPEGKEGTGPRGNGQQALVGLQSSAPASAVLEPAITAPASDEDPEAGAAEFEEDIATAVPGDYATLRDAGSTDTRVTTAIDETDSSIPHLLRIPYCAWQARPLPDPRAARIQDVTAGLMEIIAVEGPMPCHRAYKLYARTAGIAKVGRQVRSALNRAVHAGIRRGLLEERNEYDVRDQISQVVRVAGTPAVQLREAGDRTLVEVPPSELGEMMQWLASQDRNLRGEALLRAVAYQYGVTRMSSNMRKLLEYVRSRYGPSL